MADTEGTKGKGIDGEHFSFQVNDPSILASSAYFEGVNIADVIDRTDAVSNPVQQDNTDLAALLDTLEGQTQTASAKDLSAYYKVAQSYDAQPDESSQGSVFAHDTSNHYDFALQL